MATVKKQHAAALWRKESGAWQIRYGDLRVSVHNFMGMGDTIFVSCFSIGIEKHPLTTTDWKEARAQALRVIEAYLKDLAREASELCVIAQEPE